VRGVGCNKRRFRLFLRSAFFLAFSATPVFSFDSLFIKIGYGGNWQFLTEKYYASTPTTASTNSLNTYSVTNIAPADRYSIGVDLKITAVHGLSAAIEGPVIYPQYPMTMGVLSYKWYPLDWYNAPFIGVGANYFSIDLQEGTVANRVGMHLTYGLNIQFPGNIFLIVDFKNIFAGSTIDRTGSTEVTHHVILTGSFSYRLGLSR